jgi:hypothetical protein
MPHRIEPAPTARAKCRGCGERIATGVLRFGEGLPNPFGEGEATHWFHLECGAYKRPEPLLEAMAALSDPLAEAEALRGEAQRGVDHPRVSRIDGAERASSGRARCRACKEAIDSGAWRIKLVFYEEGRFSAAGFLHLRCAPGYFETADILPRVRRFAPALSDAEVAEISAQLQTAPAGA